MVGIIFVGDLKYCPYLHKYTDILYAVGEKYEVLFWNREYEELNKIENHYHFDRYSNIGNSVSAKLLDFILYSQWLRKKLKSMRYDKLILLTTLSGVLIEDILLRNYRGCYIIDIRDFSYENNKIFYYLEKKLIENSYSTVISSEGFKSFLPENRKYISVHNFNVSETTNKYEFKKKLKGQVLNLVWIGLIRYFEHQKMLLDALKNDQRFFLTFHGSGPDFELIMNYCKNNKIENVELTGSYKNEEKAALLVNRADILNNCYMSKNYMKVGYAISNKFYDGIIYHIPQLVEIGTFKHDIIKKYNIGIGLDVRDKSFSDNLYNYYFSIKEDAFNEKCENLITNIVEEDEEFKKRVDNFIKQ